MPGDSSRSMARALALSPGLDAFAAVWAIMTFESRASTALVVVALIVGVAFRGGDRDAE